MNGRPPAEMSVTDHTDEPDFDDIDGSDLSLREATEICARPLESWPDDMRKNRHARRLAEAAKVVLHSWMLHHDVLHTVHQVAPHCPTLQQMAVNGVLVVDMVSAAIDQGHGRLNFH